MEERIRLNSRAGCRTLAHCIPRFDLGTHATAPASQRAIERDYVVAPTTDTNKPLMRPRSGCRGREIALAEWRPRSPKRDRALLQSQTVLDEISDSQLAL